MENYDRIKELISAYIDGETTAEETKIAKKAIEENAKYREYYNELKKVSSSLTKWREETLSPDLTQKMAGALYGLETEEGREMKTKRSLQTVGVSIAWVAIFAVLIVGVQQYTAQQRMSAGLTDKNAGLKWNDVASIETLEGQVQQEPKAAADSVSIQFKNARPTESGKKEVHEAYYLTRGVEMGKIAGASGSSNEKMKARKVPIFAAGQISGQPESYGEPRQNLGYKARLASSVRYDIVSEDHDVMPIIYPQPWPIPEGDKFQTEEYDRIYENQFLDVTQNPLSTFSIDVDTASYSNVRRFLSSNNLPPKDAVRIEELVNYFTYEYPAPKSSDPFSITTEINECPWNTKHKLALIGLQGKTLKANEIPPSNLVFLIDVSGSMRDSNKLPLLKEAFKLMVQSLRKEDTVSIAVYAGSAGLVLEPTPGDQKTKIIQAIDRLRSGGSTAGAQGIKLAYDTATTNFIKEGNNRVILATDGDFNVGVSSTSELVRLIEEKREQGIFLTVLGFGMGNYKDSRMEQLADKGNGNYAYIDTINEAKKVLVSELGSMLFTIAKDVKLQLEFNPSQVKAYRLIGYENRILAKEDFNDDTKDAGELGAGHAVTALYELVPSDSNEEYDNIDPLKYQKVTVAPSNEMLTVKFRYKEPAGLKSKLITNTIASPDANTPMSENLKFASAVAEFGLLLRDSKFKENASYNGVLTRANESKGKDTWGYRAEFIQLVEKAKVIDLNKVKSGIIIFKGGVEQ